MTKRRKGRNPLFIRSSILSYNPTTALWTSIESRNPLFIRSSILRIIKEQWLNLKNCVAIPYSSGLRFSAECGDDGLSLLDSVAIPYSSGLRFSALSKLLVEKGCFSSQSLIHQVFDSQPSVSPTLGVAEKCRNPLFIRRSEERRVGK